VAAVVLLSLLLLLRLHRLKGKLHSSRHCGTQGHAGMSVSDTSAWHSSVRRKHSSTKP
jgi:hypothetical protein